MSILVQNVEKDIQIKMGDKLDALLRYYQDNGLTIFEFGDFYCDSLKKQYLFQHLSYSLKKLLSSEGLSPNIINFSSPMVCYPKYLNYILDSNLNLEVLNLARMYGMFGYLEKKCQNDDLLNILVSLSKIFYQKEEFDSRQYATDILRSSKEPLFIYSCGASYLKEHIGGNKFDIVFSRLQLKSSYKYYRLYSNMIDNCFLDNLIEQVRINFEHIYSLNSNTDVIVVGCHIPKVYLEELKPYQEMFLMYNKKLHDLCIEYGIFYVDQDSLSDVMVDILSYLYGKKELGIVFDTKKFNSCEKELGKNNLDFIINTLYHDYYSQLNHAKDVCSFFSDVYVDDAFRDLNAKKVFERVKRYHNSNWRKY